MRLNSILKKTAFFIVTLLITALNSTAQVQSGFVDESFRGIWNGTYSEAIVGITFDANGRTFAWTKDGRVFVLPYVLPNTNKDNYSWSLMLDIRGDVKGNFDGGMLGFVLDPDFFTNGFFYVYYSSHIVGSNSEDAAIGRVKRFKANNPNHPTLLPTTDYGSPLNKILIGESNSTGIPITKLSHMGGTLVFGTDYSLIVSTGDGAYYSNDDNGSHPETAYQECLNRGVMTNAENIGANRSQLLSSHCGKLLRIDPNTGDGLPSNPYYNPTSPRIAQSRVWASGFRNPFRIMHIPLTGNHTDDPGDFLVGDVGQGDKEEYNLVVESGQNFGWPFKEGMDVSHNRPLTQYAPANPQKPIVDYRTGTGRAIKNDTIFNIGSPQVPGINPMQGNSAVAGVYYDKDTYPPAYKNTYFVGDASGIVYNVKLDANYNVQYVNRFNYNIGGGMVSMAIHPIEGTIYYVSFGNLQIRRMRYSPGNQPPIAKIKADTTAGISPLITAFSALDSYDPDNQTITYQWNFGDGSPVETTLAPHHVFTNAGQTSYKVKLTVTDPNGEKGYDSLYVSLNNTPPVIDSSSIHSLNSIAANAAYPITLSAFASDDHTDSAQLTYVWKIMLAHNDHEHLYITYTNNNQNISLPSLECEKGVATYWIRIYLIVTDQQGLSTTYTKDVNLNCVGLQQSITFPAIPDKLTTASAFALNATASSTLPVSYYLVSGPATVGGSTVTLTGKPGPVKIRATQHGNVLSNINQAPIVERTFNVTRSIKQYTVTLDSVPPKLITSPAFTLNATDSSGLAIKYFVVSGPATLSNGNLITLTGQEGTVRVRAVQAGNYTTNGAFAERVFTVTDPCPPARTLTQTLVNGEPMTIQAGQTIQAANLIQSGANVVYQAGAAIELNPGFQAEAGSVFKAQIQGCN